MKMTEIIRGLLDVIDGLPGSQPNDSVENLGYQSGDIKRFKQIVDLAAGPDQKEYSTAPNEQYADIDAVTVDAGSDSWQGTKHPADIRGEHPSLYPGTVHGAR
jgi:hypothetical protein